MWIVGNLFRVCLFFWLIPPDYEFLGKGPKYFRKGTLTKGRSSKARYFTSSRPLRYFMRCFTHMFSSYGDTGTWVDVSLFKLSNCIGFHFIYLSTLTAHCMRFVRSTLTITTRLIIQTEQDIPASSAHPNSSGPGYSFCGGIEDTGIHTVSCAWLNCRVSCVVDVAFVNLTGQLLI
jgi:hypothetical protein